MIDCSFIKRALAGRNIVRQRWVSPIFVALAFCSLPSNAQAAACMDLVPSTEGAGDEGNNPPHQVIVADSFVDTLEARGMEIAECRPELETSTGQQALRDSICGLAFAGNEDDQIALAQSLGVHPGLLCLAIEAEVGPWQGEKFSWSYEVEG